MPDHWLFITGKLAEPALQRTLVTLSSQVGFTYTVAVLPITVIALATTQWIARHLQIPEGIDKVLLPGLCNGDLAVFQKLHGPIKVERGPKDLRDLPEFFGQGFQVPSDYGVHDITILAEINHAPRLPLADLIAQARQARTEGADIIDVGCEPGEPWSGVGQAVRALRAEGLRVSIDSFQVKEIEAAVKAGTE